MLQTKAPSGRAIWKALRDEFLLNLYPLPFSTLAPSVYHIYLHPDDFAIIEAVAPRIVAQLQRALTTEVEAVNKRQERRQRWPLRREELDEQSAIELPPSGWEIYIQADRNGELERGHLGIISRLSVPAPADFAGTPTTRIVKTVVGGGTRRASPTTEVAQEPPPPPEEPAPSVPSARLTYEDEEGTHAFVMRKDSIV